MITSDSFENELMRIRVLFIAMMTALLFLVFSLMREQVFHSSTYEISSKKQSIRLIRIPGERGRIFDRNHVCLVDNRPSYCIAVYVNELRVPGQWRHTVDKVENVLDDLSSIVGIRRTLTREDIFDHIKQRLPLPLLAWKDIDARTMARMNEMDIALPGVGIYCEPVRTNMVGGLAAHLLGYVGRAEPPSDEEVVYNYHESEMEGKYGVEKTFGSILTGKAGCKRITVDASGCRRGEEVAQESEPGMDVVLTIDVEMQRMFEEVLKDVKGAAVAVDPRNGDVLAMVSSPAFDPNLFAPTVSKKEWARLLADPQTPMVNRAISGEYAPGSTFKPLVAITALESGMAEESTQFACDGCFEMGNIQFHCWQKSGHGVINMRKAIEQSCNSYFCQLGLKCEFDRIHSMAQAVGFGKRTGIDLDNEKSGLLPSEAWKLKTMKEGWRKGDTCNISIGQGALNVTPLQMAMFTAALANGGYVYRPRLRIVHGQEKGELVKRLSWSAQSLETVRGGMHDVIMADTGTGKRARVPGIEMAGKTGTAEYGSREERKKNTWMLCFAPFESPRYAVAMLVEDGMSGGLTVAPRMRKVMETVFGVASKSADKIVEEVPKRTTDEIDR